MTTPPTRDPLIVRLWIAGAAVILLLAAAITFYVSLDGPILDRLAQQPLNWHSIPAVDAFRQLGKALVPLWLLVLWTALSGRSKPLVAASIALILTMLIVVPLKGVTQRLRPSVVLAARTQDEPPRKLRTSDKASFPSGDTATAFAVATTLASQTPWVVWPALYGCAAGVGVLRVTGMNHFPSDVCAGAAFGILAACLALRIAARVPQLARIDAEGLGLRCLLAGVAGAVFLGLYLSDPQDPLIVFLKAYWPLVLFGSCLTLRWVERRRAQRL